MVHPCEGAVGERLRGLQESDAGVDVAARWNGVGEQDLAGFDLRDPDSREVEGRAGAGVGNLGGAAMVLYAAYPRAQTRCGVQGVARPYLPAPQRPRHHDPDALEHERAVHGQPRQTSTPPVSRTGDHRIERQQQVLDTLAGFAADMDHWNIQSPGLQQFLDLQGRQFYGLFVHRIGFRECEGPLFDTEESQDVQVFSGLGHDAVVGGDDEQECIDPRRSRDHVLDEALVPRHVDQARPPTAWKVQLRVAWHDGDAPAVLLFQTVGVGAGHVANERGLAVVHVPRRPDGEDYPVPAGLTHGLVSRPR